LRISTARFAELMGVSPWELADLLRDRGLKHTNPPGFRRAPHLVCILCWIFSKFCSKST
jgi:hypothetical protein